jgi:cytidylate kinase
VNQEAGRALVVAIDGPSGSGKSSTSRAVAAALGLRYLDTGAMYRATTWWMLQHGVDVHDAAAVATHAQEPVIESTTDPAAPAIRCDGVDVSEAIRGAEVTAAVSAVSAVPEVRARMVALQRDEAERAAAEGSGIVVEGRDIGGVVLPGADLKVFLVASETERARRRALEDALRAGAADPEAAADAAVAATAASLARRDAHDTGRAASPLRRAEGAVEVDATHLTLDEVVAAVVALAVPAGSR